MKRLAAFFAALQLLFLSSPAVAQSAPPVLEMGGEFGMRVVTKETWIEEWDEEAGRWVRIDGSGTIETAVEQAKSVQASSLTVLGEWREPRSAARYSRPSLARSSSLALAQYGPFMVMSPTRAAVIGSTNGQSPAQFDAMLRDFPGIAVLELVEAPGTSNDIANLAVGRRIRDAGIATHVPSGGSVRSGAVELFLAGARRSMAEGAQFAVHSWLDNYGREASDLPANHPAHRLYLDYYVEMGMSEARARDFYAMTNSVPHHSALWLQTGDMRPWLKPSAPILDYGDLSGVMLADIGVWSQPVLS